MNVPIKIVQIYAFLYFPKANFTTDSRSLLWHFNSPPTYKFESYYFKKSIWRSKPGLQMKHILKKWLKIAKIHLLVDGDEENWLRAYSQKEMTSFLYMENNILKSSNLCHSLKVYQMLLTVSGTRLDIAEKKLNVMVYLPSGHSWICWLFDVFCCFFCSEEYVKGISKREARVQLKKE